MSGSAAILIVVIVIIRAMAINKLLKRTFLVLWGVALCRLLIPFTFPSPISFHTLISKLYVLEANKPAAISPEAINPPEMNIAPLMAEPAVISTSTSIDLVFLLTLIWIGGAIICALFFVIVHLRCRREYKTALPVGHASVTEWEKEHPMKRCVQIRQYDKISAPLTYGVLKPVVLLPKSIDWENELEIQYVLTHEYTHIRRLDVLIKWLLALAAAVHWFNPLVWVMYVLANRDIELSCDEAVVRSFGETAKSSYALALLRLEEKRSRLTPLCNNFSKNAIEERIRSIMKIKKTSLAGIMAGVMLVIGTVMVFATSAAASSDDNADIQTQTDTSIVLSHTDVETGELVYSTDGGGTWMTENEFNTRFPMPEVEWWTYDEYKAWLDNEKIQLQDIVGGHGWNPTDGWFVWTQKRIDEAIKRYEEILEEIKNGQMISKNVDGSIDIMMSYNPGDIAISQGYEADIQLDRNIVANSMETAIEPYKRLGVSYDKTSGMMMYEGQPVREIFDSVPGALITESLGTGFSDEVIPDGAIDLTVVYENGFLTGLRKSTQEEFDKRTQERLSAVRDYGAEE